MIRRCRQRNCPGAVRAVAIVATTIVFGCDFPTAESSAAEDLTVVSSQPVHPVLIRNEHGPLTRVVVMAEREESALKVLCDVEQSRDSGAGINRRISSQTEAIGLINLLTEGMSTGTTKFDRLDGVRRQRRGVAGIVAPRQDAAMDQRMQRLDAAVHHLGEAGDLFDQQAATG